MHPANWNWGFPVRGRQACVLLALLGLAAACRAADDAPQATTTTAPATKPVAAIVADWFANSHPDVIFGRILRTYSLDGTGEPSRLRIASVFRDMPTERDLCGELAARHHFTVASTITDALTLGTGKLAVDGVLLSTEWAPYPESPIGATMYPKRRMFEEIVKVFTDSGRSVPVFIDKHVADSWDDAKWIYDQAKEHHIPLMAGSSLPFTWRRPPADVKRGARLKEIVGVSYHTLTTYGFHGLEMVQTLAERRAGGETGVVSVQCLTDQAVWDAAGRIYDPELLDAAVARIGRKIPEGKTLQDKTVVREASLIVIDYADGLRVNLFTLNDFANQWTAAWRYADDGAVESTQFWLQEENPQTHFAAQMRAVEDMVLTGHPSFPVERTLLTSGILDAALVSRSQAGRKIDTPYLKIAYQTDWSWQQPPDP